MIFRSLCLDGFLSFAPGSEPFELRPLQPLKARARAEALRWRLAGRGGRGFVEESLVEARVVSDSLDLANSAKKSREFDA